MAHCELVTYRLTTILDRDIDKEILNSRYG